MNIEHIFVSQRNQPKYEDYGCGVACLMMLLKHIEFHPLPIWVELCQELNIVKNPIMRGYQSNAPEKGLYPEDLFRYVIKHDLHFRMHFYDTEWQQALMRAPIMVLLNGVLKEFPDDAHWVVITQLSDGYFSYLDPWEENYQASQKRISSKAFKRIYAGIACQLLKTSL